MDRQMSRSVNVIKSTSARSFMCRVNLICFLFIAGLWFNDNVLAENDTILEPDNAFQLSASLTGNASVQLIWEIADGYSLYKHKLQFVSLTPGIELSSPVLPDGLPKHDTAFGNVEIYRNRLQVDLPFKRDQNNPERFSLSVTYQGCADQGICYLPITKKFSFD